MHDNDPEVRLLATTHPDLLQNLLLQTLEREKRRNLNGNQHKTSTPIDDAPGWNEDLATASEAHVKVSL